jgi:hypothetical protein
MQRGSGYEPARRNDIDSGISLLAGFSAATETHVRVMSPGQNVNESATSYTRPHDFVSPFQGKKQ